MTLDQGLLIGLIVAAMALFIHGRWRYDIVALGALLVAALAGLVPMNGAFVGFAHPAVLTVAFVLVISHGLSVSGAVERFAERIAPAEASGPTTLIVTLGTLTAVASAFMNNVGALALVMPLAVRAAQSSKVPPALVLMPLAFASMLGGMTTLIGTPPNLIVSGAREAALGEPYALFDFAPVGLAVALAGLVFVALIGWRLLPADRRGKKDGAALFDLKPYLTEVRPGEGSKLAGMTIGEIEDLIGPDAQLLGLIRDKAHIYVPSRLRRLRADDLLILEASPDTLKRLIADHKLELEAEEELGDEMLMAEGAVLLEAVVRPESNLIGLSAMNIRLRDRFDINLLAISRQGEQRRERLTTARFEAGDVLLLQGDETRLSDFVAAFGLAPLADRAMRLGPGANPLYALAPVAAAIALTGAGLVSAPVAFCGAAVAMVLLGVLPLREMYRAIDWSVIVLLAAMIPIATAVETTGLAAIVAAGVMAVAADGGTIVALALILVATMTISDLMNNAATAALMAPIAIRTAEAFGANPDAFLMAVAVGASCAFLTPIGHQNNTLILGPGGYRFSDFWRMGLPLEIIVAVVSTIVIAMVWL